MELGVDGLAAVKALADARAEAKKAQEKVASATAQLRGLLGEDRVGTLAGVTLVKVTSITRHGVNKDELKKDMPEIYARYETTTTFDRVDL